MSIIEIEASILKKWMQDNQALIIDVREKCEHDAYSIPSSVNIPLSSLLIEMHNLEVKGGRKIVLYCTKGIRSMLGCQMLLQDGFTHQLYNLKNGLQEW
ncbi:MAG TPA: rhodanese-like domain-containing protein [Candidatus Megaira endosymbiont of Nemacystus decipiens]|nr:rhodanese-like domain-containing protein [Candidatus Megaera endosymbiont of Nemacystus decipiens]